MNKLKDYKDQLELMDRDRKLAYVLTAYKYDKITYQEFVELLNFIQRHFNIKY